MTKEVTRKYIKENFDKIIQVGYCNLPYLLKCIPIDSYCTSKLYGWRCDNYLINNNVIISTGYNPVKGIKVDYDIVQKYELKAQQICKNTYDYTQRKIQLDKVIQNFIKEII